MPRSSSIDSRDTIEFPPLRRLPASAKVVEATQCDNPARRRIELGAPMRKFLIVAVLFVVGGSGGWAQWQRQESKSDAALRGLSVVAPKVAWVSGTNGRFGRTIDSGATWSVGTVAGAEKLDFRDVEAFGDDL